MVPMGGVDRTRFDPAPAPEVAEAMPGLEATQFDTAAVGAGAERLADVDAGRASGVGEVPAGGMADMESGRAVDDGVRTQVVRGQVTCRYCRKVQKEGALCEGCGMKLPVLGAPAAAAKAPTRAREAERARCPGCGARVPSDARCTDCGAWVPEASR